MLCISCYGLPQLFMLIITSVLFIVHDLNIKKTIYISIICRIVIFLLAYVFVFFGLSVNILYFILYIWIIYGLIKSNNKIKCFFRLFFICQFWSFVGLILYTAIPSNTIYDILILFLINYTISDIDFYTDSKPDIVDGTLGEIYSALKNKFSEFLTGGPKGPGPNGPGPEGPDIKHWALAGDPDSESFSDNLRTRFKILAKDIDNHNKDVIVDNNSKDIIEKVSNINLYIEYHRDPYSWTLLLDRGLFDKNEYLLNDPDPEIQKNIGDIFSPVRMDILSNIKEYNHLWYCKNYYETNLFYSSLEKSISKDLLKKEIWARIYHDSVLKNLYKNELKYKDLWDSWHKSQANIQYAEFSLNKPSIDLDNKQHIINMFHAKNAYYEVNDNLLIVGAGILSKDYILERLTYLYKSDPNLSKLEFYTKVWEYQEESIKKFSKFYDFYNDLCHKYMLNHYDKLKIERVIKSDLEYKNFLSKAVLKDYILNTWKHVPGWNLNVPLEPEHNNGKHSYVTSVPGVIKFYHPLSSKDFFTKQVKLMSTVHYTDKYLRFIQYEFEDFVIKKGVCAKDVRDSTLKNLPRYLSKQIYFITR